MSESEANKLYGELRAVNAKIDHLTELFNHAAHGEGFVRCARHSNRLQHVEESLELSHARISGVKKWLVAGLISILSVLANFVWNLFQVSLKQ